MANVINTRIQLKYDTLANWQEKNPTLLSGEIAIATVGNSHTTTTPDNGTHPVVFKVGPGAYNSLPFTSALAADVYAWAKEATLTINKDGTGNVVAGIEWDATANGGKGGIKYTTASVATSEGLKAVQDAIKAINDELDTFGDIVTHNVAEFQPAGNYKTKQTAVAEKGAANQTLKISQDENGVITTEAVNIAITTDQITGLGTAAFTASTDYATAAQGTKADNAAKDIADILNGTKEAKNAAYATEAGKVSNKLRVTGGANYFTGDKEYDGSAEVELDFSTLDDTVKSINDTLGGVKTTAESTASKLDAFLEGVTPDGSADIIDTLAEINQYITSDTEAFTGLSTRVTNIENGTTKAGDADKLDGHDSDYFATATALEGVKTTAEAAAPKNTVYTKTEVDTKLGAWTITDPTGEQPPVAATGLRGEIEDKVNEVNESLENYKLYNDDRITHIVAGDEAVGKADEASKTTGTLTFSSSLYDNASADYFADLNGKTFNGSANETIDFKQTNANISNAIRNVKEEAQNNLNNFANELPDIAKTGSIYDVTEAYSADLGASGTEYKYFIFNCGTASTLI